MGLLALNLGPMFALISWLKLQTLTPKSVAGAWDSVESGKLLCWLEFYGSLALSPSFFYQSPLSCVSLLWFAVDFPGSTNFINFHEVPFQVFWKKSPKLHFKPYTRNCFGIKFLAATLYPCAPEEFWAAGQQNCSYTLEMVRNQLKRVSTLVLTLLKDLNFERNGTGPEGNLQ